MTYHWRGETSSCTTDMCLINVADFSAPVGHFSLTDVDNLQKCKEFEIIAVSLVLLA